MRLLKSSKAQLAVLGLVGVVVLAYAGRIDGEQALNAVQWLIGLAIGGTALEDGMGKLRGSK